MNRPLGSRALLSCLALHTTAATAAAAAAPSSIRSARLGFLKGF